MNTQPAPHASETPHVNENVYQQLKEAILFGGLLPDNPVTLRGLADKLGVSPTPVREAVKRLISERALTLHTNRRVSVPIMTEARLADIRYARIALECQLADVALSVITAKTIKSLTQIDFAMDSAIADGNAIDYMRHNHQFHFTLYSLSRSDVLLALVESLWLQMSPYLYAAFGQYGTHAVADDDYHKKIITALENRDVEQLRHSVKEDIAQGIDTFSHHQNFTR